ncbi:MAG TPA: 4-(cytidine 5'-diphospho)-2-C-methyl-D-erythritol kinase [Gemmatimonadaceae bacterium]
MTTRVAVAAQAKLNLWLRILAREESGYHSIETLFHRIKLCDDVTVTVARDAERRVTCSVDVGPETDNLAFRAAELYCSAVGWQTGYHIAITKRIPAAGGLGGGSADAAATLRALNVMSPSPVTDAELCELGSRLGADIPFLLSDAPCALAWGHGDRMLKLSALPQKHVALVLPPFGISTAEAYRMAEVGERRTGEQLRSDDLSDWSSVARLSGNDLSASGAVRAHGRLAGAIEALRDAGAAIAEMTGSGSVLFGIFGSRPDSGALERATGWPVVLTRTSLNVEGARRLD